MASYQQMGVTYKNESVATLTCTYTISALLLQDYIRAIPGQVIWRGDGMHFMYIMHW